MREAEPPSFLDTTTIFGKVLTEHTCNKPEETGNGIRNV